MNFKVCRQLLALFLSMSAAMSARAADEQTYWALILSKQKAIYDVIQNPATSYDISRSKHKEGDQLRSELIQRMQSDAALTQLVRKSLRNDNRAWVRGFSVAVLIKAFGKESVDDAIYGLSDPDSEVRGFAIGGILAGKLEGAAWSLPASLLSKDAAERSTVIYALRKFLGEKGLPYYSALLYDSESKVAKKGSVLKIVH